MSWPLNKGLPRGSLLSDLQIFLDQQNITKKKVATHLKNYKKSKYGLSQVKIILCPGELYDKILCGLGMPLYEFVINTLEEIIDQSSSSSDFNIFLVFLMIWRGRLER